jgi:hypothetical protein
MIWAVAPVFVIVSVRVWLLLGVPTAFSWLLDSSVVSPTGRGEPPPVWID